MLTVKVKGYKGRLIMILNQRTEYSETEKIGLYKVVIEINEYETVTLEKVRANDIEISYC